MISVLSVLYIVHKVYKNKAMSILDLIEEFYCFYFVEILPTGDKFESKNKKKIIMSSEQILSFQKERSFSYQTLQFEMIIDDRFALLQD